MGPIPQSPHMASGAVHLARPPGVPVTTEPAAGGPVVRPGTPVDPAKLWKTARDFEAMVLGEFLKPMFATTDSKKSLFTGQEGEKTWKPMLVDEIAKQVAARGGLGLATPLHDAMLRMQEGTK
jgi:flagellar protein FlgJ